MKFVERLCWTFFACVAVVEGKTIILWSLALLSWPDPDWAAWVQAIGSIAAIAGAGYGVLIQLRHSERLTRKQSLEANRDVILALISELSVYGNSVEQTHKKVAEHIPAIFGNKVQMIFPSTQFRFPVYKANAARISAISEEKLRGNVIAIYADLDMFFALLDQNSNVARRIPMDSFPEGEVRELLEQFGPIIKERLEYLNKRIPDILKELDDQSQEYKTAIAQ